mgnify:CR=1 FL=1|jgi:ADP-ribose diphosphatase
MQKPVITETKTVAKSHLFRVEEVHLTFSNGEKRIYERLCPARYRAVMIVPLINEDTILLVREYSVGVEGYTLGFPKGLVEPGENLLDGANRELMEEVGMGAHKFTYMRELMLSPNYMQHKIDLVLAEDLYEKRLEGDEPELLEVVRWKLSDIDDLLAQPDFIESRSLTALLLLWKSKQS